MEGCFLVLRFVNIGPTLKRNHETIAEKEHVDGPHSKLSNSHHIQRPPKTLQILTNVTTDHPHPPHLLSKRTTKPQQRCNWKIKATIEGPKTRVIESSAFCCQTAPRRHH